MVIATFVVLSAVWIAPTVTVLPVRPPPLPDVIVTSIGSTVQLPRMPFVARVSTEMPSVIVTLLPDVSTLPPSPLVLPPFAENAPA